jgi:hypothetical protein
MRVCCSPSLPFCSDVSLFQGAAVSKKASSACLAATLEVPLSSAAWLGFFTTYQPSCRGYLHQQ